jgi:hypothetical protein
VNNVYEGHDISESYCFSKAFNEDYLDPSNGTLLLDFADNICDQLVEVPMHCAFMEDANGRPMVHQIPYDTSNNQGHFLKEDFCAPHSLTPIGFAQQVNNAHVTGSVLDKIVGGEVPIVSPHVFDFQPVYCPPNQNPHPPPINLPTPAFSNNFVHQPAHVPSIHVEAKPVKYQPNFSGLNPLPPPMPMDPKIPYKPVFPSSTHIKLAQVAKKLEEKDSKEKINNNSVKGPPPKKSPRKSGMISPRGVNVVCSEYNSEVDDEGGAAEAEKSEASSQGEFAVDESMEFSSGSSEVIAAREKRRARNKVLARRTREKKKMELDLTRHRAYLLQCENERLKEVLRQRVPAKTSAKILSQCDANLAANVRDILHSLRNAKFKNVIRTHVGSLLDSQKSFLVADASKDECPIVFASPDFYRQSGYEKGEVINRSISVILQGLGAEVHEVRKLKSAIEQGREDSDTLKCFRAVDGGPYLNRVQVAPLLNITGRSKLAIILNSEVGVSQLVHW